MKPPTGGSQGFISPDLNVERRDQERLRREPRIRGSVADIGTTAATCNARRPPARAGLLRGAPTRSPIGTTGQRSFGTDTRGTIFQDTTRRRPFGGSDSVDGARQAGSVSTQVRRQRRGGASTSVLALRCFAARLDAAPRLSYNSYDPMSRRAALFALAVRAGRPRRVRGRRLHPLPLLYDPTYRSFCDVSATVSCTQVYQSRFGTFRGIPVAVFGALWFVAAALLSVAGLTRAAAGAGERARVSVRRCRRSRWP